MKNFLIVLAVLVISCVNKTVESNVESPEINFAFEDQQDFNTLSV